jgi:tryptophan-rich sensory protein
MASKVKAFTISIAIPLIVGAVAAFISRSGMADFGLLKQPPLTPPKIVFPIVWTILFILMGISSYLIKHSNYNPAIVDNALTSYGVQLGVNFFWPIFFFKFGWYLFSFIWLLLLLVLIIVTTSAFYKISRLAAYLMLPYIAWVMFAGYLNLGIYFLN